MRIDRTSRRILGALVEKRFTTPEQYPLTLNALVLACNQKSNRDPEMRLEDFLVEGCLRQLRIDGWVMVVERDTGRVTRYGERFSEQLALSAKETAVLAELMLRGPQTEQDLHRRCERMAPLGTLEETVALLESLVTRGLVRHLPRRPGQRVARWTHLLAPEDEAPDETPDETGAGEDDADAAPPPPSPTQPQVPSAAPPAAPRADASAGELRALRDEVETLRAEVTELRGRLDRLEGR